MSQKRSIIIACLMFIIAVIAVAVMEDTIDVQKADTPVFNPKVTVSRQKIDTHSGNIKIFAEVKPRWNSQLKAHIAGEITYISDKAMAGSRVDEGNILLQIEDSLYQAKLAEAKQYLTQSKLDLLQTQKQQKQAKADWKRSGLTAKPSDLALYKPQVALAQQKVDAAEKAVNAAEKDLEYTKVRAPFSGVLTKRFVSKGQTLQTDDLMFHILSQDKLDITVTLSANQWQNLVKNWADHSAVIKNDKGYKLGTASIKRGGGFLDSNTRQYKIFLEIHDDQNILPGEFVYIDLLGKPHPQTIRIPAGAYTREHTIWYVDEKSHLRFFESDVVFYDEDYVITTVPDALAGKEFLHIAHTPLSSFTAGQIVDMQFNEITEVEAK